MIKTVDGSHYFEPLCKWKVLDYTIVARHNRFAPYSDNYDTDADKLFLTFFRINNNMVPFKRFELLENPMILENRVRLTRKDPETNYFLEYDKQNEKVRLYREV